MTAFDLMMVVRDKKALPMSTEHPCTETSNSEVKRWFKKLSIVIDGVCVTKDSVVSFPVSEVVFFPKGKRLTTMGPFMEKQSSGH